MPKLPYDAAKGFTPVSLRRAARTGDGFLFGTSPSRMLGLLGQLKEMLAKEGRKGDGRESVHEV